MPGMTIAAESFFGPESMRARYNNVIDMGILAIRYSNVVLDHFHIFHESIQQSRAEIGHADLGWERR